MPLQKLCNCCKQEKPVADFYRNKRMRDGLNTFCIECHKADNVRRKQKNRADEEFKARERTAKAEYRARSIPQRSAYMQLWRKENADDVRKYSKRYREQNKARYNFLCQRRKIDLLRRTPKWLSVFDLWAIAEAYELASLRTKMLGVPFHVDHVIPLRGKLVSGLHTPHNLRVVPALENMRKTNKFEV